MKKDPNKWRNMGSCMEQDHIVNMAIFHAVSFKLKLIYVCKRI